MGSSASSTPRHDSPSDSAPAEDPRDGERQRRPPGAIDVVIVTADSREMTTACVEALKREHDVNVIVVDNCSQDGTSGALRSRFGGAIALVELERPASFACACNAGAASGEAPFVLFLNSDIFVLPGSIATLLAALRADPFAVAAGGRLVDPETLRTQPSYLPRRFPGLLELSVVLTGVEPRWPNNPISRRYHGRDLDENRTQPVCQPAAAALIVRRAALERVGGFDERYWFWFEDSDLLRRLSDQGRILWVPAAAFPHVGGASFSRWGRVAQVRSRHHGMLHYAAAHLGRGERLLLGLLTVAVSLGWIARLRGREPEEADAWRAIMRGGGALVLGRPVPDIALG